MKTLPTPPQDLPKVDFSCLYQTYYPILYRYGMSISQNEELVMDAIQELFMYLWEKQSLLSEIRYMKGYLLLAYRRRVFKKLNKLRMYEQNVEELSEENENCLIEESEGNYPLLARERETERTHCISVFLNSLSPRKREMIILRYYEGLNHQEIADYLGIKYQTVLNQFHAAFKQGTAERRIQAG